MSERTGFRLSETQTYDFNLFGLSLFGSSESSLADISAVSRSSPSACASESKTLGLPDLQIDHSASSRALQSASDVVDATPFREDLTIYGGNRQGRATLLLPDNYDPNKKYPLIVELHGYNGNAKDFANMTDAEGLRKAGNIVLIPEAQNGSWQGDGIGYFGSKKGTNGQPVNDVQFVEASIKAVEERHQIDRTDITIGAFSQGASVGWEVAKDMDASPKMLGRARNFVTAAGSNPDGRANHDIGQLPGTNIVQYEPEKNGIQKLGNSLNSNPAVEDFLPEVIRSKVPTRTNYSTKNGVTTVQFSCSDGSTVTFITEAGGEHAWPGQPASYDSNVFGRGSISHVNLTDYILRLAREARSASDGH